MAWFLKAGGIQIQKWANYPTPGTVASQKRWKSRDSTIPC